MSGASSRGERAARVTRCRRPGFTRGLAVAGRQLSPRPSDASPTARRAAAHRAPGDRPPAVPAVSRCRARQLHGQAEASRRVRRSPGECHRHRAGTPRIVRAGPSSVKGTPRSFLTASQKRSSGPALERRSLCQPSGPDGEGQARGQARMRAANLRGQHGETIGSAASLRGRSTDDHRGVPEPRQGALRGRLFP